MRAKEGSFIRSYVGKGCYLPRRIYWLTTYSQQQYHYHHTAPSSSWCPHSSGHQKTTLGKEATKGMKQEGPGGREILFLLSILPRPPPWFEWSHYCVICLWRILAMVDTRKTSLWSVLKLWIKMAPLWSSHRGSAVMNPTSIYEDAVWSLTLLR